MRKALLLALLLAAVPPARAAQPLRVEKLSGGALTVDGRPYKEGQQLPPGKPARLEKGATLVLDAGRWGKLLMHGPTVFTANAGRTDGLALKAGGVLSALHKFTGRSFSVRTPAVALAVRGTTFYAEARGKNASYVCICDGALELTSDGGAYHSTLTSQHAHRSVLIRFDDGAGLETEAPMQHHSDAEIAALGGAADK